jgi:hypothetical protein
VNIENQLDALRGLASTFRAISKTETATPSLLLSQLRQCKSTAEQKAGIDRKPIASPVSLATARLAWQRSNGSVAAIDRRSIRILCWDPDTCLQPQFYRSLAASVVLEGRTLLLRGLLASFFQNRRADEWDEELGRYLRASIARFTGSSTSLKNVRDSGQFLLNRDGPEVTARKLVEETLDRQDLFGRYGIPVTSGFASAVVNSATRQFAAWLAASATRGEDSILERWRYLKREILAEGTVSDKEHGVLLSAMILHPLIETMTTLQSEIRQYAIGHPRIGDPRLHSNRWAHVHEDAKKRFLNWLAKEWISFFFEQVLPKGADPHGRKAFWLQYSPKVVNFSVVLNYDDYSRLRPQIFKHKAESWICRVDETAAASAFILQFQGIRPITVIEFSLTGNATRVYSTAELLDRIGSVFGRRLATKDLKSSSAIDRIVHSPNPGWQDKATQLLARLGVRR